jgi:general stress protein YciG
VLKQTLNDKWCLNENIGGVMSLSSCRKVGKNHFKNCTGAFSLSKEDRTQISKKVVENNKKNKVGIFAMNKEEILDAAKKGGKKSYELKTGIFSISPERRSAISKKMNLQRWKCLETGYVSTPAGLGRYQRARGIDTSRRERIV